MTAPIVLFVYARPEHTRQTLDALSANELASDSDLIVYADAARTDKDRHSVEAVRTLVSGISGFRTVNVYERETNYGLARNIIEGVAAVCDEYGKVIVLEDDIITSPAFLRYMNDALDFYKDNPQVWHISGWNYPIDLEGLDDAFFLRIMNCWGWGTWIDRWKHFEKNTDKLITQFDRRAIRDFDLDDSGVFWSQVLSNREQLIDTWAIYWYATIFRHQGLCLNPVLSYVDNIGLDGSGTHGCQGRKQYATTLNCNMQPRFPAVIAENTTGIARIIQFYRGIKPTLPRRILGKVNAILGKAGLR